MKSDYGFTTNMTLCEKLLSTDSRLHSRSICRIQLIRQSHSISNQNRILHFILNYILSANFSFILHVQPHTFTLNLYRHLNYMWDHCLFRATVKCNHSSFSIIRNFMPNHGRILPGLTFNQLQPLNVNTGRIMPGFGRKLRIVEKLEC